MILVVGPLTCNGIVGSDGRMVEVTVRRTWALAKASIQKGALVRLTGLLLWVLEHILANLDLDGDSWTRATTSTTGTPVNGAELITIVHTRLMELPEVVKLFGAINTYALAKLTGSGNDRARTR